MLQSGAWATARLFAVCRAVVNCMTDMRANARPGLASPSDCAYPNGMTSTRLTPDTWLAAGFDALQELGAQAIAAEPLARRLGTTKGSFYWHFRDVPTFQDALLIRWQEAALAHVANLPKSADEADQKLRQFGREIMKDRNEVALRIWAQRDQRVAAALNAVDNARRDYLVSLLEQLGLGNPDFARALQATLVGLPQISPNTNTDQTAPFNTLVDTVLALADD